MIGNRTEFPINHANAYTNNTFSLTETEKNLKRACFNSFNYLEKLQKSYVSVHRFNLTENDLYTDYDDKVCLTIGIVCRDADNALEKRIYEKRLL